MLINLIGNSFKFTTKGSIKISACQSSSFPKDIEISIEDTGIGISEENLK